MADQYVNIAEFEKGGEPAYGDQQATGPVQDSMTTDNQYKNMAALKAGLTHPVGRWRRRRRRVGSGRRRRQDPIEEQVGEAQRKGVVGEGRQNRQGENEGGGEKGSEKEKLNSQKIEVRGLTLIQGIQI